MSSIDRIIYDHPNLHHQISRTSLSDRQHHHNHYGTIMKTSKRPSHHSMPSLYHHGITTTTMVVDNNKDNNCDSGSSSYHYYPTHSLIPRPIKTFNLPLPSSTIRRRFSMPVGKLGLLELLSSSSSLDYLGSSPIVGQSQKSTKTLLSSPGVTMNSYKNKKEKKSQKTETKKLLIKKKKTKKQRTQQKKKLGSSCIKQQHKSESIDLNLSSTFELQSADGRADNDGGIKKNISDNDNEKDSIISETQEESSEDEDESDDDENDDENDLCTCNKTTKINFKKYCTCHLIKIYRER